MKKFFLTLSILVSVCSLRAQDTIYPFTMDYMDSVYPFMRDSISRFYPYNFSDVVKIDEIQTHGVSLPLSIVYGLNIAFSFQEDACRDSVEVRGVLIKVLDKDYDHPIVHYTRPIKAVSQRQHDLYMAVHHPRRCYRYSGDTATFVDSVMGMYSLYFENPVQTSDSVYLGFVVTSKRAGGHPGRYSIYPADMVDCDDLSELFSFMSWRVGENGTVYRHHYAPVQRVNFFMCAFPIFSAPDTDSFQCREVEGFAYAGVNAGSPTFVWDTAGEHTLYQLAYGPYNSAVDSLTVVETENRFIELMDRTLTDDIYYQARVRAKCMHACPLHDTVMWTAWSDPVFFYTGDSMPDTSYHQPIGIADRKNPAAFSLSPNPASTAVTLTLEDDTEGSTAWAALHDTAGREVMRQTIDGKSTTLSVQGLAAGVYTVTVYHAKGSAVRRLVVE